MSDRVETIRAMLEKEPNDPFLHYSLAMDSCDSRRFAASHPRLISSSRKTGFPDSTGCRIPATGSADALLS